MPFVHLHTDAVSVVVDARGPYLPAVLHWGAPLGDLTEADLETLADAVSPPPARNATDAPRPVALLPESSTGYPGREGLRGHRGGQDWTTRFTLTGVHSTAERAVLTATDEHAGLTLTTELELSGTGMLRLRHRIGNQAGAPYTLDGLVVALPVPARAGELLDTTGRWGRERHPQRHAFQMGTWSRESHRGRTGFDAFGMVAGTPGFSFRGGEVWAVHVAWSGNHVHYAERFPESVPLLGGGELLLPGEVLLDAGESYTTPWVYAAYSDAGIDGVSATFHRWLRARDVHPAPSRPRPAVFNVWEAVYFDHDLGRLRTLAETAARIGVERFVLDDGWFRHRRDDTAGLGDWYVDEQVWPDGLHPLVDHVRNLGMEFGLWVEPEMVNPDSDLFRAHPDWTLAPAPDRLPQARRNQQVLDLANPAAYAYILERLDALLGEYDIAYLKWDHNRDLMQASHTGHASEPRPMTDSRQESEQQGVTRRSAGVHAQTLAVYRLIDELRGRHPGVEIESCSSGGARVDLEVLERTERVWVSDCTDALERQRIQLWTGVLLPPELLGTHVSAPVNHQTARVLPLSLRVATALFGHFGIEWDVTSASPEDREVLAAAIDTYKRHRDWMHQGTVVRSDHPDPSALLHGVVAADGSQALFSYAQLTTSTATGPGRVVLPGLDPARRYRISTLAPGGEPTPNFHEQRPRWLTRGAVTLTGRVLAAAGLDIPALAPANAVLIHAEAT